jgi:hypothetical protein
MTSFLPILSASTPDQVLKSVGDTLDAQVNPNHLLLIVVAIVGVIVLISLLTRRSDKKDKPRPVNNPSRLMRQITRQIGLKSAEMRQLRQLAEQENLDNPLVLLLCPSVLQSAVKKRQQSAGRK